MDQPAERDVSFEPLLYSFRVSPPNDKSFALQLPFALLFDNTISVLWSVYSKQSKIQIGINQMQWALEFLKCMKLEHSYPECIGKIVYELEKQLIELYSKVSEKLNEQKMQKETEKNEDNDNYSLDSEVEMLKECVSLNEKDVMDKLKKVSMPIDPTTGEPKYLKELNSLGKRKKADECKVDNKSSKTYVIGALQKILNKTADEGTKTEVEELIKGLKVDGPSADGTTKPKLPLNNKIE